MGGASAPLYPFSVVFESAKTDVFDANIRHALAALAEGRVKRFEQADLSGGEPLHIIAGGPSAGATLCETGRHVVAVNGAHDWLLQQGIVPTYAAFVDWSQTLARQVTPDARVGYYAASQCHPDLIDKLPGLRVWHTPYAGKFLTEGLCYGGGPSITQRIIPVFHDLGYRDFHFHGVDCCFGTGGEHHSYPWDEEGTDGRRPLNIRVGGRDFRTRVDWAGQAQWFFKILDVFRDEGSLSTFTVTVHGDGLIPHMARMKGVHAHSV